MPKIRTSKSKRPPEGFEDIEDTLLDFDTKLKDAEIKTKDTSALAHASSSQSLWPIYQLHHQRSRYIYDLFYKKKAISAELYAWLLRNRYADANLIAKWKKQGYENLCCLKCIQVKENVHGNTCICRVPRSQFGTVQDDDDDNDSEKKEGEEDGDDEDGEKAKKKKKKTKVHNVQCFTCGCRGCASTD